MRILLSNDDGIHSPGLHALAEALADLGEIWVVAPDREQSSVGHAITLSDPIWLRPYKFNGVHAAFAVGGTPADCVKLALTALMTERPDLIVSGINRGENTGISTIYSGTVSAATEGTISGVPSMAISLDSFTSNGFGPAARIARKLAVLVARHGLPQDTLLNVNVPDLPEAQLRGIRITRQGRARWKETFEKRVDPRGRMYYWMDGYKIEMDEPSDTDGRALKEGFVAITPVRLDMTHGEFMDELKVWLLELPERKPAPLI
ncbi:MAG: 5'/3'-nucleotidase SurE [Calditrichaeota bacterium]|nr:5'/3'-nucleotidase SurE [Calditrichota bacterium]